ncbi:MAG: PfaD family polyunsaturated fatty acid/polyketide biosynthesis protein [Phycisphaerae bacterium]
MPAEQLGDPAFRAASGLRYAYVAGAMANGIASTRLVIEMARGGMLGFFGAAGLDLPEIESSINEIQSALRELPYGSNLIHSPHDPQLEKATVDLYLRKNVRCVSASAYLGLTPHVVRFRVLGLREEIGRVFAANRVVAKVSRTEVATKFLSPPPEKMLRDLVASREITERQATLASTMPMCDDLTAEADSGGHTDNRPALALIPTMIALRDNLQQKNQYDAPPRVGAAGGISTPESAAAAFAMGAAYILTGSVNQSCVEAGTSDIVRKMLADAQQADVIMAPAADMFEMGVQVQVLKRGTMFAMRGKKLYELYRTHRALEEIPATVRTTLERDYFRGTLEETWDSTKRFFKTRDPAQIARAERDPRHKMALVFRSYLGQSSTWANAGIADRQQDYQVWCGPAMGAFNEWVKGTFLELPENRTAVTIARNILNGAAKLMRINCLRAQGVAVPSECSRYIPREL